MTETDSEYGERVRWIQQGALFRVVVKDVAGVSVAYKQRKRSCDDEWQDQGKLGVFAETNKEPAHH